MKKVCMYCNESRCNCGRNDYVEVSNKLPFDDWCDLNGDLLDDYFYQMNISNELDFDFEKESEIIFNAGINKKVILQKLRWN